VLIEAPRRRAVRGLRLRGNRSLVTTGSPGWSSIPPRRRLAERLGRVLDDEGLARGLGQAGRALAVARYDLGVLVGTEIALLRRVAGAV